MITIPYLTAVSTYFSYGLLFAFGQLRDYSRRIFDWWSTNDLHGYAPICLAHEDFYIRRLYHRIQVRSQLSFFFCFSLFVIYDSFLILFFFFLQDCFGRPIASAPDAWVDVVERFSNDNNKTLKSVSPSSASLVLHNTKPYVKVETLAVQNYWSPLIFI